MAVLLRCPVDQRGEGSHRNGRRQRREWAASGAGRRVGRHRRRSAGRGFWCSGPARSISMSARIPKTTVCLWFDHNAEDAAKFYAQTFPGSSVGSVRRAPGDYPNGTEGDALVVEFIVLGVPCIGINGGPAFKHSEAFSFQVATDSQEETDRYWNAIVGNGGQESQCGWCKDKWGLSWQITPKALTEAMALGGEAAKRAFAAMMAMKKIDVAAIEAAVHADA